MNKNKGLTVNQLLNFCKEQVEKGNGKKHILISQDDEGNGYHELFFQFGNAEELCEYADYPYGINLNEYIILG